MLYDKHINNAAYKPNNNKGVKPLPLYSYNQKMSKKLPETVDYIYNLSYLLLINFFIILPFLIICCIINFDRIARKNLWNEPESALSIFFFIIAFIGIFGVPLGNFFHQLWKIKKSPKDEAFDYKIEFYENNLIEYNLDVTYTLDYLDIKHLCITRSGDIHLDIRINDLRSFHNTYPQKLYKIIVYSQYIDPEEKQKLYQFLSDHKGGR